MYVSLTRSWQTGGVKPAIFIAVVCLVHADELLAAEDDRVKAQSTNPPKKRRYVADRADGDEGGVFFVKTK